MGQVTLKDLSEWIDIQAVHDGARANFESQQRRRRNLNDWIINLLPVFMILALIAFYLLSAPHTVGLLNKVTPGWGWISPVGFELFIIVLSAARQAGWQTRVNMMLLYGLLASSILINVAGGFIAVVQNATDLKGATFAQLLQQYGGLPAELQVVLILVPLMGFFIPVAGKVAGEFVIKIGMGEIKFQSMSLDDLWLKERASQMKSALMRAALKRGAGTKTAGAWAQRVIDELYGEGEETLSYSVPAVRKVPEVLTEMGFASHLPARMDNENTQDRGQRAVVLNSKRAAIWIDENSEYVKSALAETGRRRDIARKISVEITGDDAGYKTVERVLQAKGYL